MPSDFSLNVCLDVVHYYSWKYGIVMVNVAETMNSLLIGSSS